MSRARKLVVHWTDHSCRVVNPSAKRFDPPAGADVLEAQGWNMVKGTEAYCPDDRHARSDSLIPLAYRIGGEQRCAHWTNCEGRRRKDLDPAVNRWSTRFEDVTDRKSVV